MALKSGVSQATKLPQNILPAAGWCLNFQNLMDFPYNWWIQIIAVTWDYEIYKRGQNIKSNRMNRK